MRSYKGVIATMLPKEQFFTLEVKTDNVGTSGSTQFTIPTTGAGYNYRIQTSAQTLTGQTGNVTLTWPSAGTYEVKISGNFPRIYFNNGGDRRKLLKVKDWGSIVWSSFENSFLGCSNLDVTATNSPNLVNVTSFSRCFESCTSLTNSNGSIGNWNTSSITDMVRMFFFTPLFNKDISSWNTGNVTNMNSMFFASTTFNQPIGSWDTSKVTDMGQMFRQGTFNQNIGSWDVSKVIGMGAMFFGNTSFNQNIGSWDVGKVDYMDVMFYGASSFNQNLSSWPLRLAGVSATSIFQNSGMSTANYTDTIVGWANYVNNNSNTPVNVSMATQTGRTFQNSRSGGAGFATAQAARAFLTTGPPTGPGWTISGDTIIA
jgi:surface protein